MRLSEHFTLDELVASENAARLNIDNTPTQEHLLNIRAFLVPGLEQVRALLGKPMIVTSGYRCPALNAQTPGSSPTSAHPMGYAADFICPGFGTPWEICQAIAASSIRFDQLIYEYAAWVHVSFDPRLRMVLTTKLAGQPYREGLHQA